jgi:hypothetical protein
VACRGAPRSPGRSACIGPARPLSRGRGSSPEDREFLAPIERLHAGSPEVRAWWPRHDVAPLSSGTKRIHHPILGDLTFHHVVLQLADDPEPKLVAFGEASRPVEEAIAAAMAKIRGSAAASQSAPPKRSVQEAPRVPDFPVAGSKVETP